MRQRLKILFYTHALTGGGAERVWALLASGFIQRGHDVVFAVDFDSPDNADYLDPAVRLVVLGGNHLTTCWRLTRLLAAEKPDISLSAIGVSNMKHAIAALVCGTRKRAIQSYHGYYESEPQLLSRFIEDERDTGKDRIQELLKLYEFKIDEAADKKSKEVMEG